MKLSKYEKETIILTNEEDQYYSVYTYNQGLQKRLKNFAEKYPECCYLFNTTKEENKMYTVSVSDVLSLNREGVLRPIMWRRVVLQYYLDLFIIVHQVRLFALIQLIFMWKVKRENGWPLTVLLWRERNSV